MADSICKKSFQTNPNEEETNALHCLCCIMAVTVDAGKVATLAEVSGTVSDIKFDGTNKSKITGLKYTKGTKVCTYDGTNYTVA